MYFAHFLMRQHSIVMAEWSERDPDLSLSSATYLLCDVEQITSPVQPSVSLFKMWDSRNTHIMRFCED